MTQEPDATHNSLIPPQPIPAGAQTFSERMHGLLDGQPKDEATVKEALSGMDEMFDLIAAGLYNLASMLVGEGEESVRLVEKAVETAEISACDNALQGRRSSRLALSTAAIGAIAQREPGSLDLPEGMEPARTCIDEDDLESAGVSNEEFQTMLAGPERDRVRTWLAGLPTPQRVIFVLRAVAGFTSPETAALLATHGGPGAAGWTAEAVREIFRQALCSLASQLIHASTPK